MTELVDAGLATDDGKLTEQGQLVKQILTKPSARVRVESSRGRAPLTFEAYVLSGQAVIVASTSPATLVEDPHGEDILAASGRVQLDFVDVSYVPIALAAWVGLAPAWSLATSPELIDEKLLVHRMDDPAVPPPADADENLKYVWSQPWFLWTLTGTGLAHGLVMVNAGCGRPFRPDPGGRCQGHLLGLSVDVPLAATGLAGRAVGHRDLTSTVAAGLGDPQPCCFPSPAGRPACRAGSAFWSQAVAYSVTEVLTPPTAVFAPLRVSAKVCAWGPAQSVLLGSG